MRVFLILCFLCCTRLAAAAEPPDGSPSPLLKTMTIKFEQQKLGQVLADLGSKGGFVFSYNGKSFNADSLVTLMVDHQPVWKILDQLFKGRADYKVHENYIILRLAFLKLAIYPENITADENSYAISGYVKDENTGRVVKQASVYDKKLLQSALTDNKGYFRIRFKGKHDFVLLTVSKELYRDTMMVFLQDVKIAPAGYSPGPAEKVTAARHVMNRLGISKFFLSSRQRIQNLNIPDFFANTPVQFSLTPGLSTHGMMSAQVVNKFSYNLIGGYTAGVSGLELGGVFNMNRGDVSYLQLAGIFNYTGGTVRGVQLAGITNQVEQQIRGVQFAGIFNQVHGDVNGVQLAGITNLVKQQTCGVQFAGIFNQAHRDMKGLQLTAVSNLVGDELKGVQFAGISNHTAGTMQGFQLASLFNYAKHNKGFQMALVNVADSSSGASFGLLNFIGNGYHQLSVYNNDFTHTGISFKSGNATLYSKLYAGTRLTGNDKLFTVGFGIGHDFLLNSHFLLSAELSTNYIMNGHGSENDFLKRVQTNLQYRISQKVAVFAGPAYSLYQGKDVPGKAGFHTEAAPDYAHRFKNGTKGWTGWNFGITFF